jgi:hypothetical protein
MPPSSRSAKTRNPHRPGPLACGFVLGRLSYASRRPNIFTIADVWRRSRRSQTEHSLDGASALADQIVNERAQNLSCQSKANQIITTPIGVRCPPRFAVTREAIAPDSLLGRATGGRQSGLRPPGLQFRGEANASA